MVILIGRLVVWATWTTTLLKMVLANPCAVAATVYVPGWSSGKTYTPLALAFTICVKLVAGFVTVTSAPGTTFPEGSNTVPVIWPLLLTCARNAPGNRQKANAATIHRCRKNPVLIDCLQQANSNGNIRQKHEGA